MAEVKRLRGRVDTLERLVALCPDPNHVVWLTSGAALYEMRLRELPQQYSEDAQLPLTLNKVTTKGMEGPKPNNLSVVTMGLGVKGKRAAPMNIKVWALRSAAEQFIKASK